MRVAKLGAQLTHVTDTIVSAGMKVLQLGYQILEHERRRSVVYPKLIETEWDPEYFAVVTFNGECPHESRSRRVGVVDRYAQYDVLIFGIISDREFHLPATPGYAVLSRERGR
jgi:hypothetical protein